jgi:hypothetical protein
MEIPPFFIGYRFPGRAGELQTAGRSAALLAELGDNYGKYHAVLARELDAVREPEPADFVDDFGGFQAAANAVRDVLAAEMALRFCLIVRTEGRAGLARLRSRPVVDMLQRLVDFQSTKSQSFDEAERRQPCASLPSPGG